MSTVLYLANQQIQVVTGATGDQRISVEQSFEVEAPEGSIINGLIMDTELFVDFMKGFWTQNALPTKDVILVINSSKFVGKIVEMPSLSLKKTYEYISREFTDVNRSENYLYSILPIGVGTDKMKRVYVESIEPDFIKSYMDIFAEIGISLKAILSGESSLIGLTAMTTGRIYNNFSLVIADSSILTTILWIDGSFYYFNSMRCFHERETIDYAGDVARSVSQINQFMQAHQIEHRLESIVIAGIAYDNLDMYRRAIEQMGIFTPVQLYGANSLVSSQWVDIQKCLRAASGLVAGSKNLNFIKQFLSDKKDSKKKEKAIAINIKPIIISAIVMIALICSATATLFYKKGKLKELEDYNNKPVVVNAVTQYDMIMIRNTFLSSQYGKVAGLIENISSYPICDSAIMTKIENCAEGYAIIVFDSFDSDAGTISITASSDNVDSINLFIKRMCELDIFKSVDYTGYAYNDNTTKWDIHVICTLAEAAGR